MVEFEEGDIEQLIPQLRTAIDNDNKLEISKLSSKLKTLKGRLFHLQEIIQSRSIHDEKVLILVINDLVKRIEVALNQSSVWPFDSRPRD